MNSSSNTYIAYCFHSVDGFSKFGSYKGNGNTDGPFVNTGFQPKFILIKDIDAGNNWTILDDVRNPTNVSNFILYPNSSGAETSSSTNYVDILSNGFKFRSNHARFNATNNYIYMAFAEFPFKYTLAR